MNNVEPTESASDFYVYMLLREDGTPFDVGNGKGLRAQAHMKKSKLDQTAKARIIRRMQDAGLEVPVVKIATGLTESAAFELECETIASYGRHPNGPLRNLSDGGEGPSGAKHTPERREIMRQQMTDRMADPGEREKISTLHTGKIVSEETRIKIGKIRKGVTLSDGTKALISAKAVIRMSDPENRRRSSEGALKQAASSSPEERSAAGAVRGTARMASLTFEERQALSKKALTARWDKYRARKAIENAASDPDQRAAA